MKLHRYNTKEEALDAIQKINKAEGIPAFKDSITQTYTECLEINEGFYIKADEITIKHLGEENIEYLKQFEV